MSTAARVESIESVKEFRAYLAKFQDMATRALGDADADVNRTVMSLEGEWLNNWTVQTRKRQEALAKAEEALRFKRLYKDATGSTPSAVEEIKAVQVAKKNLAEAQEKLSNIKRWTRQIQKEIILYRGGVARFGNAVSSGVPQAIAQLGSTVEMLEKYTELAPAGIGGEEAVAAGAAGADIEAQGVSMARGAEELAEEEQPAIHAAAVRGLAPTAEQIAAAQPLPAGAVRPVSAVLGPQAIKAVALLAASAAAPEDDTLAVISAAAIAAPRIYLLRSGGEPSLWCIGSVDGGAGEVYNTIKLGALCAGRPELLDVLRLPPKTLVIIVRGEIEAIYNEFDENIYRPPAQTGTEGTAA